jgi:hypothetical protein
MARRNAPTCDGNCALLLLRVHAAAVWTRGRRLEMQWALRVRMPFYRDRWFCTCRGRCGTQEAARRAVTLGRQHLRQRTAQGNATPKRIPVRTPGGPEQMGSIALPVCLTIWAAALRHVPCPVLLSMPPLLLRCRHGGHSFTSGQRTAFPLQSKTRS